MESEFELTQLWETDMIVQFPKISAIYCSSPVKIATVGSSKIANPRS